MKIECKISKNSDNLHLLLIMFFSQLKFYLIIEIPKLAESWSTEQVLYGGGSVCWVLQLVHKEDIFLWPADLIPQHYQQHIYSAYRRANI